jgi:LuxR family maltose regulon positive regulatory protein
LQLAALSMQQREDVSAFVQSFTGSHRQVLDYVQEEILARLPVELQQFLSQIAILNKISPPLCQAITGEAESWARLAQAEQANLFLVPLDEERRWYRMHDLSREALLTYLRTTQPEMVILLRQRAATYYEKQGEWREAISYYLEAADFWSAARLMEQAHEELWLSGESQVFFQWVMALPLAVIHQHARFVLNAALYTLNVALIPKIA